MAAPWEKYQSQQQGGPWQRYGTQVKQPPPGYSTLEPKAQAELTQAQLNAQKTQGTLAADEQTAKAQAKKATIDANTAQEQWNINHPSANGTEGLSGPSYMQFLQKTDPGRAAYIQGLAEGRVPFPGGQMMRSPAGQALLTQVMRADPTIDATNYTTRAAGRKNAAAGTLGGSDNAITAAVGHAARLATLVPDVFGSNVTPFNSVANAVQGGLMGGKQPTYDQNAQLLGDEVAKVYGGGAQGDRQGAANQFSSSLATSQKNDNIRGAIDLMLSKLAANRAQFAYGNGGLGKPDFMLLPQNVRDELKQAGASDLAQKYFSGVPVMGANGSILPPGGGGQPPAAGGMPPPVAPAGGTPPGTPPTADYSGLTGGPGASLAATDPNSNLGAFKQTYRTVYDPVGAGALAALIRKGAPYDTAAAYATSHGFNAPDPKDYAAAVSFAQQHKGAVNVEADRYAPTTLGERLSSSPAAAAVAGSAAGATAGLSDVAGRTIAGPAWDANRAALAATSPKSDFLGNLAGGAAGMLAGGNVGANLLRAGESGGTARNSLAWLLKNPVAANAAGDTAYGTTYGASENPDNPLGGAALGAVVSPIASLAGYGASKTLGGLASGITNPAIQRLKDAGIPLTVGEALGPGAKKVQDAFSNIFPSIGKRYKEGRQAVNQAAFDQGGAPIGATSFSTGQAGINALSDAKSKAYSSALDPININLNTPQFVGDIKNALNTANNINPAELPEGFAANQLRTSIGNQIGDDGTMSGPAFQAAYRGLSKSAGNASGKVEGYDVGQALGQGQDALVNALSSDNPGAYNDFLNANRANRNLNVLSSAVNSAKNQDGQLFTPNQLGTASTANARSYNGQIAAAGGDRPFNQLINDANSVMSSKLGDSGTFARLLAGNALLEGGGALGGYGKDGGNGALEGAEGGLGIYTLGSLLGSRAAQKLLVGSLIKRPQAARSLGDLLVNNPRYLASASTAAQVPYFTTP